MTRPQQDLRRVQPQHHYQQGEHEQRDGRANEQAEAIEPATDAGAHSTSMARDRALAKAAAASPPPCRGTFVDRAPQSAASPAVTSRSAAAAPAAAAPAAATRPAADRPTPGRTGSRATRRADTWALG